MHIKAISTPGALSESIAFVISTILSYTAAQMTETTAKPTLKPTSKAPAQQKRDRQKQALKANLRRRKNISTNKPKAENS